MKRILVKLSLFLPIALFIAALNYFVDPSHLFIRGAYERGIAQLLLDGKNVANAGNHDARLVQKYYIEGLRERKDVIVLGSSRSMFIRSYLFPGKTFFNSSVSAATIEDFVAIYGAYRRTGKIPHTIIMTLDPWLLDGGYMYSKYKNWLPLRDDYTAVCREIGVPVDLPGKSDLEQFRDRLETLISLPYFLESFKHWISGKKYSYYPTENLAIDDFVQLKDGSSILDKQGRSKTTAQVRSIATSMLVRQTKKFQCTSEKSALFNGLVKLMRQDGVNIVFFLPPYHPLSYRILATSSCLSDVRDYYQSIAAKNGITVIGNYNPEICQCTEEDFDDSSHARESGIAKIFKRHRSDI